MSAEAHTLTTGRSWREIRQEVKPRAMSRQGRRRRLLGAVKVLAVTVVLGAVAWLAMLIVHSWETDRAALAAAVKSEPVREISLITDGTLTKTWVEAQLALAPKTSLMALDLAGLRDRLLAWGQIKVAVITRSFPDMLVVTVQERTPVARVQIDLDGRHRQFFVAKDGVVYEGVNYDRQLVASLPWLDGVRLRREGDGISPVANMEQVSNLLTTAQLQAPHLYRTWLVVSLARLESAGEISVKAQDVPEIVFSAREDFFRQIAKLDYILEETQRQLPEAGLQSVNLALGGQVPVRLAETPAELLRQQQKNSKFVLPTNQQRKGQRDL